MLQERVTKQQRELDTLHAMQDAVDSSLGVIDDIEKAVHRTRQMLRKAQPVASSTLGSGSSTGAASYGRSGLGGSSMLGSGSSVGASSYGRGGYGML